MTKQKLLDQAKRKKVKFSLQTDCAESVHVSGDFCEWNIKEYPMKLTGDSNWVAHIILPAGQYEYKFLVDGQWKNDLLNDRVRENGFGTYNNILNVNL